MTSRILKRHIVWFALDCIGCSKSYHMESFKDIYEEWRGINDSGPESGNAKIAMLKGVSTYFNMDTYMHVLRIFLEVDNRKILKCTDV